MSKIGLGVIGTGTWGEMHARVYADIPGAELAAVCDANIERAKEVGEKCGAKKIYGDYNEMLADPDVHAVSVVLPDFLHHDAVIACAKAGKHILVEKPLATTEAEAIAMINAAREAGVHLYVDFHTRWSPLFAHLKTALEGGELGEAQMVYYRQSNTTFVPTQMLKWAGRSSVAWFLSSHCLDTMLWLLEARQGKDVPERLYCVSRSRVLEKELGVTTPDFFQTTIEWKSGLVTQLENCWILPAGNQTIVDMKCEWIGAKGAFYVDGSHHGAAQKHIDRTAYLDGFTGPTVQGKPSGFGAESVRHFGRCMVDGTTPITDGIDGLAVTRLILKMLESAESRQPVEVGPLFDL